MVAKTGRQFFPPDRQPPIVSPVINVPLVKGTNVPVANVRSSSTPLRSRDIVPISGDYRVQGVGEIHPRSKISNSRSLEAFTVDRANEFPVDLECDYDTNATVLYELLESSDWEKARARCRTHSEEVRTWICRRDKNGQVRWRLLPLHAAIIFQAPSFVVSALLEKYPAAAAAPDDQGMLGAHLAFRHKQDDEDLLELLLVQYPKALLMRDRRDRVPLDHGRESRFSAKLMRLYGETMAAATGHSSGKMGPCSTAETNTAVTADMTHSAGHSQLARMEAEYDAKLAVVRGDYEFQLRTLHDKYEERIRGIQEKTAEGIREVEQEMEMLRQGMIQEHNQEMSELREQLTRQVKKEKAMTDTLHREVGVLQESLQEAKDQADMLTEKYGQLINDNENLRDMLDHVYEDQEMIKEVAMKQQEYLDAAQAVRTELLQTLIKQEDRDAENDRLRGTTIIELSDRVQRSIGAFIETRIPSRPVSPSPKPKTPLDKKGPSRVEVERAENDRIYSDQHGQTEVQAFYLDRQGKTELQAYHVPQRDEMIGAVRDPEEYPEIENKDAEEEEEDYGEVRILGDEISAITENSAY